MTGIIVKLRVCWLRKVVFTAQTWAACQRRREIGYVHELQKASLVPYMNSDGSLLGIPMGRFVQLNAAITTAPMTAIKETGCRFPSLVS